jgi:hypothetical protein
MKRLSRVVKVVNACQSRILTIPPYNPPYKGGRLSANLARLGKVSALTAATLHATAAAAAERR